MIPLSELKIAVARERSDSELWVDRFFARRLSIYLTWLLAHTPLSANEVTLLSLLFMAGGATCLGLKSDYGPPAGALLMVLGYLLDCSDGEIARLRGQTSLRGMYLGAIGHAVTIPAMFIAAGIGLAYRRETDTATILGGIAAIASTNPAKSSLLSMRETQLALPAPAAAATATVLPGDSSGLRWLYLHTFGRLTVFPNSLFVVSAAVLVEFFFFRDVLYGPIFFVVLFYAVLLFCEQCAAVVLWSREARLTKEVQ